MMSSETAASQGVQKERFSAKHAGRFRVAHGKPPYTSFVPYSGLRSFSEAEAFLLSVDRGEGLALMPLVFWYPCEIHRDLENGHGFLFDKMKEDGNKLKVVYKAASFPCRLEITGTENETADLVGHLLDLKRQDPQLELVRDLKLTVAAEAQS